MRRFHPLWGRGNRRRWIILVISALTALVIFFVLLARLTPSPFVRQLSPTGTVAGTPPARAPQLHVAGNQFLDSNNRVIRFLGVNRSGTEYQCLHSGIFDGPSDQTSINAMLTWHINAIRIPLNEDCWLNVNLGTSRYGGTVYQQSIANYVHLLISNGITPILDLHWSAPGSQPATGQKPLPDRDHSITFWSQVARAYRDNNAVVFDLFNEPYPDNNQDTTLAWQCWKNGTNETDCPPGAASLNYAAAGMQELVTAVRNTGAINVIMVGGIQYAGTLDYWMDYKPTDPVNQIVPSWHPYNTARCSNRTCWIREVLPLMKHYPVIAGEIGEDDAGSAFITQVMSFMDAPAKDVNPQSYLAWVWNTDQSVYDLITDYTSGTPTSPYGSTFRNHILSQRL